MIAELLPDPSSYPAIGWILVAIAATVAALNQVLKLTDRMKPEKVQPPYHEQFASSDEFDALKASNTQTHSQLFNKISAISDHIGERIEDLSRKVERLDERSQSTNETVKSIREELTEVGKEVTSALAEIRSRN